MPIPCDMNKMTKNQRKRFRDEANKVALLKPSKYKIQRPKVLNKLERQDVRWSAEKVLRPSCGVQRIGENEDEGEDLEQVLFPHVFMSPIRPNLVKFVHGNMRKNSRQPYAVYAGAGHQHSAESWGTGRAVSRIPRVSGGGTSRAGQGAFGNMCRSGRMFAPTKTWRKWHVKINLRKKRYATASALAASAVPALVEARGHRIDEVPEIPLVVDNAIESVQKTKQAIAILESLGAYSDVEKVKASRHLRPGRGKMRNRRYVQKKGPLIVYKENHGVCHAFRNLPGVDLCRVENLDIMKLAPGGQMGRFIVWSQAAFNELVELWGSWSDGSRRKKNFILPRPIMTNPDLSRIINSVTIQTSMRAKRKGGNGRNWKKNPLKNLGVMVKLNPYALEFRRQQIFKQRRKSTPWLKEEYEEEKRRKKAHKKAVKWRQKYNLRRIKTRSQIVIKKELVMARKAKAYKNTVDIAKAKARKEEELRRLKSERKFRKKVKKLRAKIGEENAKTEEEIRYMVERHYAPVPRKIRLARKYKWLAQHEKKMQVKKRKYAEKHGKAAAEKIFGQPKNLKYNPKAAEKNKRRKERKKAAKAAGAKKVGSAPPEQAKPFKTYDNDDIMGKPAPVDAIRKLKYVQGKAPKKGNAIVVLLWRKSYKSGYKFMPLYTKLSEDFKDKPVEVVGVCVDRDKNAAEGFLKKYTNGPKGNFTTSFAIGEEWAPANKVYPLKGRDVEKGFLDHMVDIHPGMKEMPSIPHVFLVNGAGTVVWHQDHSQRGSGAPDHMDQINDQVSRLLSGKMLLSVGSKIVKAEEEESESEEESGDGAVGDMGDFFTNL